MKIKGEHKIKSDFGMQDYYNFYRRTVKMDSFKSKFAHNSELIVDKLKYTRIIRSLHDKIVQKALDGDIAYLPHNFGYLYIRKHKMNYSTKNKLKMDYAHFKKTGQRIFHLNENRNGYRYTWHWKRFNAKIPTKFFYRLRPTRYCTRTLAKLLLSTDKDYPEMTKYKWITNAEFKANIKQE